MFLCQKQKVTNVLDSGTIDAALHAYRPKGCRENNLSSQSCLKPSRDLAGKDSVYNPFNPREKLPLQPSPNVLSAFRTSRRTGTRPFYSEGDFNDRMLSILDKTLYSDIPFFLPSITDGNLRLMKAITGILTNTSIPRLQVRSLYADWAIGTEKLYQLFEVMQTSDLLRFIQESQESRFYHP